MEQALACQKTDTGYKLVSPPKGSNKKYQARTSGKPIGQRDLGQFEAEVEAALQQEESPWQNLGAQGG